MAHLPADSLPRIVRDLREGRVTARELTEVALSRHDAGLAAYVTWAPDFARRQADAADAAMQAGADLGGLQGIPVSFKDLYGVSGLPTYAGSPRPLPAPWASDGELVARMRRQLCVITGKTHTVEFAFGGLGTSRHHPVPVNPRDRVTHRAPGGSSSGAGVSVVEGSALVAFGTDTGGSVRIPASLTGTVGLKTTHGRWSTQGIVPLSPSFNSPGILCRSAIDAAFAFTAIDGAPVPDSFDAPLRLGVADGFFWSETSPGVAECVQTALRALERDGAQLTDAGLTGAQEVFDIYRQGGIVSAELFAFLSKDLPDWLDTLDPRVRRRMHDGSALTAADYLRIKSRYATLSAEATPALAPFDALVCPTVPLTPPPVALLDDPDIYAKLNLLILRNTCVVSFLGLCAVTIPAGLDAVGMPVGLQLIGPPNTEARLIAIARRLERTLDRSGSWTPPHRPD